MSDSSASSSSDMDSDASILSSDDDRDSPPASPKEKEKEKEDEKYPPLQWPSTEMTASEIAAFADYITQCVVKYVRSSSEGMPWEDIKGQDTSEILPGLMHSLMDNYAKFAVCVSRRTREVVGKEHPDYLSQGVSPCDILWKTAAHLIYVEESYKPIARKLAVTSANMFAKRDFEGGTDTRTVHQRYLFSIATLTPVLQSILREWNRMDGTYEELEAGKNHNRLSWNGERLDMLRVTCAVTTVAHSFFRASKKDGSGGGAEDTALARFNHLCARLFYWTELETSILAHKRQANAEYCQKLYARVEKCRRQFYSWIRIQMQIDLERGREFGDVFRRTVYSLELGAASEAEYGRMHPTKSELMISNTEPMHMFMDTDTDLQGDAASSTERYDVLKKYFESGLTNIAKRDPKEAMGRHPLHQALMLSVVAYFFEQVHRRKFIGRYCLLPHHLPDVYEKRDTFFEPLACKIPPREKRPRIVCTGASVHVLFRENWIPMKGLVDACIAFFVLCRRFQNNELETGAKISPMFLMISLESLEGIET